MKRFLMIVLILLVPFKTYAYANTSAPIEFTAEEQAFLDEHPKITMGVDPQFIPYEFIDTDGQYKGIAADYIKLLSQKIGIEMVVQPDKTWPQAYEMAVEKQVDALPCVSKTTERQQYFLFSDPYFAFQRVILVSEDNTTIRRLADLKYTTTAVQENSSHHSYLKNIPEINLSLYATVEEALMAVSKGYETSFVGNLATCAYLIKSKGITGLNYVSLDSEDEQYLYFAVRDDWPILVSILNKGLSRITEEEKMAIHDKWIGLENKIDYTLFIRIAVLASSIVVVILIVSAYWIFRLKKEIAKRTLLEEELRCAKTDAELANRVKSTFLARMSHEIRTPLNAITGMAYLIKKSDITLSQRIYVDKITQAAHNMLGIINDILDFSKIEAGKVEIECISFNLDKVIQQVISIISFRIEEQGISFALSKGPQIPVYFIGDPKRIEQILINLLSNAVKFTTDGEVSLSIRLVAQEGERYHLEFAVKDTGIGMSEEQIAQLFTPFAQADSTINRRFGGTGLGLSIVKSLVEMMNGDINIYSTEGKGTTFVIKLPLILDASKDFEEKKRAASLYVKNIRTLVLTKNDSLINLIESYLVNFGIPAEFTTSHSNASQLLEAVPATGKSPYNLLIIDYDLLSEKSFEFTKLILENPKLLLKPKIIMLIPLMREDLLEKIEFYGLNLGITKPIIPSVLFDGIQEIFKTSELESSLPIPVSIRREDKKAAKEYKVLVIEDNKTNQFIAKSILEQVGVQVALADNGEEGANYYEENSSEIDLILMDLHMPVLNGYEATLRIRTKDTVVPIVAMTADAITGIEEQCRRVGIDHYISKPFEPDKFIDTILEILDQHAATSLALEQDIMADRIKDDAKEQQAPPLIIQEDALKLLGNNIPLYHMVLKEFRRENTLTCVELDMEFANKNYLAAAQIVHKAKGSSGNIGAKELYSVAAILQKALENTRQEEISKYYPKFILLMQQCLSEIGIILNE